MRLRLGNEKLIGLAKPVETAEHNYDWIFWLIMAVASLAGVAYLIMEVV